VPFERPICLVSQSNRDRLAGKRGSGMAKKARPKGRKAKAKGAKRRGKTAAARAQGPVTLQEAKALAGVVPPARKARAAVAEMPTSPEALGIERKRLEKERELERRRRIDAYKTTLDIMKRRGVKGLGEPPGGAAFRAGAPPLQVFAEGDSWFDYPIPFHGDVISRLEDLVGVPILNLAKAGDEVRYMLGTEERRILAEQFTRGCPAGGPWDAMLFSGGGNDIVGNPLALWVRDFDPLLPPKQQVDQPRFDAALALVRAGYEDLIRLRDDLSPGTQLFFHAYDFAIPDGRGVCSHGPWLKPSLDLRGVPDLASGTAIVRELLLQFAGMLERLTLAYPGKVSFVNTQNTLPPQKSSWHNELHPSKQGFKDVARVLHSALKARFPARVL
jgi:hypothetical protein